MAIAFARARYLSRASGGNAVRSAAYNAREAITAERTGELFHFRHSDAPGKHHEVLLPEGADPRLANSALLWNAAEAAERRKDAQGRPRSRAGAPGRPGALDRRPDRAGPARLPRSIRLEGAGGAARRPRAAQGSRGRRGRLDRGHGRRPHQLARPPADHHAAHRGRPSLPPRRRATWTPRCARPALVHW